MKLHFNKTGNGQPILILHGLFGSGDNWTTFARTLSTHGFEVFTVDLRNHGRSEWNEIHDYSGMASDVYELISAENLKDVIVIGHSMGGKVAMTLAVEYPSVLQKLIVADIGPKYYKPHHQQILAGLLSLDFQTIKTRGEADNLLAEKIADVGTRQFLLKNLYWKTDTELAFRFNLQVLNSQIEEVGKEIITEEPVKIPSLFIGGSESHYILKEDREAIKKVFSNSEIIYIDNAGHWIHADQPALLLEAVLSFLGTQEA